MFKVRELWLKERDTMDKMIEQLLDEVKQLKAKLKEMYNECEDLIYCYTQEKHIRFKEKWVGEE